MYLHKKLFLLLSAWLIQCHASQIQPLYKLAAKQCAFNLLDDWDAHDWDFERLKTPMLVFQGKEVSLFDIAPEPVQDLVKDGLKTELFIALTTITTHEPVTTQSFVLQPTLTWHPNGSLFIQFLQDDHDNNEPIQIWSHNPDGSYSLAHKYRLPANAQPRSKATPALPQSMNPRRLKRAQFPKQDGTLAPGMIKAYNDVKFAKALNDNDTMLICVQNPDNSIHCIDSLFDTAGKVSAIAWHPDGNHLACATSYQIITICSLVGGCSLNYHGLYHSSLNCAGASPTSVIWHPRGTHLVSTSLDKSMQIRAMPDSLTLPQLLAALGVDNAKEKQDAAYTQAVRDYLPTAFDNPDHVLKKSMENQLSALPGGTQ